MIFAAAFPKSRGFSLVEVMVAVVVICVGLLGIAKMQALSLSSTNSARLRSLAAFQAASLASAMHSNRNYWAATPPTSLNSTDSLPLPAIVAVGDNGLQAAALADLTAAPFPANDPTTCTNATCQPVDLAAFDYAWWLTSLHNLLPDSTSTVACSPAAPASCTIQITWRENAVNSNSSEKNDTTNTNNVFQNPTYTLYVEP